MLGLQTARQCLIWELTCMRPTSYTTVFFHFYEPYKIVTRMAWFVTAVMRVQHISLTLSRSTLLVPSDYSDGPELS